MRINKHIYFMVILLAAAPAWSQDVSEGGPAVENDHYRVSQVGKGEPWFDPSKGGMVKHRFLVQDKVKGREGEILMDNMTSRISRLELLGDRLLVIGEESSADAAVMTLIGLEDGAVLDTLMGFDPSLSPGKKFLAYRKFFSPEAADPPKRSDLVLVYDLEQSADQNRIKGLKRYRNNRIGRLTEVGQPAFPELNAKKKRYRVWVRDANKRHTVLDGGFFWLDNDLRLVFVDRMGEAFMLVVVDHGHLKGPPEIHRASFDPRVDDKPGEHSHDSGRFELKGVVVLESGKIQIRLSDREGEDQFWRFSPDVFEPVLSPTNGFPRGLSNPG